MITGSTRARRSLAALIVAGLIAALLLVPSMTTAAAAGRVSNAVSVNPLATPAGAPVPATTGGYGLFPCQVGLSPDTCYDPYQMRTAYQLNSLINHGIDGSGRTIVIVDAFQSPTIVSDLAAFDSFYGLPAANLRIVAPNGSQPFDPTDPNMVGWAQEITLDVEWAHAMAPGAKIVLDESYSDADSDIVNALRYALKNDLGDVISQSYGENEGCVAPSDLDGYHDVYTRAARQGVTVFASSGDTGAADSTCDGNSWLQAVEYPASDPLVTSVGGTELPAAGYCLAVLSCNPATHPAPGTYQGEIVWNEFDSIASGGGYSTLWRAPDYQRGAVSGSRARAVPDVAYNAAVYHGILVLYDGAWYYFGGTSCGTPQWAAIAAIADQYGRQDLGFINPALYRIAAAQPFYAFSYHDIITGNNAVTETEINNNPISIPGYNAGPGWDAATGLGSPIADHLVPLLVAYHRAGDNSDDWSRN